MDWLYVFRSDTFRNDMVFEVLDKKIFCSAFLWTWYINIATFKVFNLYTFKTLFHRNNCFVCSNFPLLQIMRIAYFCWLHIFIRTFTSHLDRPNIAIPIYAQRQTLFSKKTLPGRMIGIKSSFCVDQDFCEFLRGFDHLITSENQSICSSFYTTKFLKFFK